MSEVPWIWIGARTTGLIAYGLLTLSMLAGVTLHTKPFARLRPATVLIVHRTLAATALGTTALHGALLVADTSVDIKLIDLMVPGMAGYQPFWTGAGVVAALFMAVLIISFRLRKFTGARFWRKLHRLSFFTFALATVHGIADGSDTGRPWVANMYIVAVALVAGATAFRVLAGRPNPNAAGRVPSDARPMSSSTSQGATGNPGR